MNTNKQCMDHLGNVYDSFSDMCSHYSKRRDVVYQRLHIGWTLEEALTCPPNKRRHKAKVKEDLFKLPTVDFKGIEYGTFSAMCREYDVDYTVAMTRLRRGWTLERALTEQKKDYSCCDHLGNCFDTIAEMCNHYGINKRTYLSRLQYSLSVEEALTKPVQHKKKRRVHKSEDGYFDHLGNKFDSFSLMCKHYGLPTGTVYQRLYRGKTLEEALTKPVGHE